MESILIFGKVPPPVGGVTKSVENTITALKSKKIKIELFSINTLFSNYKFDIAHIHYSKKWKIFIAILLGKLYAKKNILTFHGSDFYPDKLWTDRLLFTLLDGIIVLNKNVQDRCEKFKHNKAILFTSIFQEGVLNKNIKKTSFFDIKENEKYILLYAYDKVYFENKEVYGCSFIFSLIDKLPENYIVVFVDPNGGYKEDVAKVSNKLIYLDRVVDFLEILSTVDIYIRPTNFDGNSVAILEALICNVPVLASNVVDRGIGIETYKNNNAKDFISKITYILNNQQAKKKLHLTSIQEFEVYCNQLLERS